MGDAMAEYGGGPPNAISDPLDWVRRGVDSLGLRLLWSLDCVGGRLDCDVWGWALAFVRGATCQCAMINRMGMALGVSNVQSTKHIPSVCGIVNIVHAVVGDFNKGRK